MYKDKEVEKDLEEEDKNKEVEKEDKDLKDDTKQIIFKPIIKKTKNTGSNKKVYKKKQEKSSFGNMEFTNRIFIF